jgi:hypothetical protein
MIKVPTKTILYIKGGMLTNVVSNNPNFQYKLIDYDNDPEATEDKYDWSESDLIVEDIELYRNKE